MLDHEDVFICAACVGEAFLSAKISDLGEMKKCEYCGQDGVRCISIADLADYIEGAFERHYIRTSDQPNSWEYSLLRDKESDYDWERHGDPVLYVISELACISESIAQDVLEILEKRHSEYDNHEIGEECEFDSESYYELRDVRDGEFAYDFRLMEESLRSENRFFNGQVTAFLNRLFSNINSLKTHDGRSVVVVAGPNCQISSFFRARVFYNSDELGSAIERPDLNLGPPPSRLARAGRMNAHGISVFYGASEPDVALAEVRPPVGSRAVIARFGLRREVRLLDVEALQSVYVEGSFFDPSYAEDLKLAKFLSRLSARITRPVMPSDEPTEYLLTQMIADFLSQKPVPGMDGVLFPSVQFGGANYNVVLFSHASRVAELKLPRGTELSSIQSMDYEDGREPDYYVWERVEIGEGASCENGPSQDESNEFPVMANALKVISDIDSDTREATLEVDLGSVNVYHIKGVKFDTDAFAVARQRTGKEEIPF